MPNVRGYVIVPRRVHLETLPRFLKLLQIIFAQISIIPTSESRRFWGNTSRFLLHFTTTFFRLPTFAQESCHSDAIFALKNVENFCAGISVVPSNRSMGRILRKEFQPRFFFHTSKNPFKMEMTTNYIDWSLLNRCVFFSYNPQRSCNKQSCPIWNVQFAFSLRLGLGLARRQKPGTATVLPTPDLLKRKPTAVWVQPWDLTNVSCRNLKRTATLTALQLGLWFV